jgi:hypothetical protein
LESLSFDFSKIAWEKSSCYRAFFSDSLLKTLEIPTLPVSQTTTPDYKRQDTDKKGLPFPTLDHRFFDQV